MRLLCGVGSADSTVQNNIRRDAWWGKR